MRSNFRAEWESTCTCRCLHITEISLHVTQKGNLTKTNIFWFTTLCLQITTASSIICKLILIFFHVFFFSKCVKIGDFNAVWKFSKCVKQVRNLKKIILMCVKLVPNLTHFDFLRDYFSKSVGTYSVVFQTFWMSIQHMLEVNKELWNAISYIYFEPLKIVLRWQFESRKKAKSTKVSISTYIFVIKRNILHPLSVSKVWIVQKEPKKRVFH